GSEAGGIGGGACGKGRRGGEADGDGVVGSEDVLGEVDDVRDLAGAKGGGESGGVGVASGVGDRGDGGGGVAPADRDDVEGPGGLGGGEGDGDGGRRG